MSFGALFSTHIRSSNTWKRCLTTIASTKRITASLNDETGVAQLLMHNAPVNTLDIDHFDDLIGVVKEVHSSNAIKALVIKSAIPRVFCAGLDLKEFMDGNDEDKAKRYWNGVMEFYIGLLQLRPIMVCAINGACPAGGCLINSCSDFSVITPNVKIGMNEPQFGIDIAVWMCQIITHRIGSTESRKVLPYGFMYGAEEARRVGLVDAVCEENQLDETVDDFLKRALKAEPESRYFVKMALRNELIRKIQEGRDEEIEYRIKYFQTQRIQDIIQKYINKLKRK